MTSITVYDGAETIGGNKIYVEEDDRARGYFILHGVCGGRVLEHGNLMQGKTNRKPGSSIRTGGMYERE